MVHQVPPIRWARGGPYQNDGARHGTDRCALGDYKQSRTRLPGLKPLAEMVKHGAPVVSNENPVLGRHRLQQLGIADALQVGIGGGGKVDARLAIANGINYGVSEVGIRLKTDAQADVSPISARARSSFSQSAGLASLSGIALVSNSWLVSSRYRSIMAL